MFFIIIINKQYFELTVTLHEEVDAQCRSTLVAAASGGTGPYAFKYVGGGGKAQGSLRFSLDETSFGAFAVEAIDANGCSSTSTSIFVPKRAYNIT